MNDLAKWLRIVPDFPKDGIQFVDILPLWQNAKALTEVIDTLAQRAVKYRATHIVAPEARGFLLGVPLALRLQLGFVPVRKPNKLPGQVYSIDYEVEYGHDQLCMQSGILPKGAKVLVVDDVLATGGTTLATIALVEKAGAQVVAALFLTAITELKGRERFPELATEILL